MMLRSALDDMAITICQALIDGSPAPRLKICDFGYSKHSLIDSEPKSTVVGSNIVCS
jgi:hypothetical protein